MVRVGKKYTFEHILVMEDHLGRKLLPGETVHHKNGVRHDNALSNLELWTKPQPSGIRIPDLIAHCVKMLELYSPDKLK
jgi:hypothetical protein